MKNIRPTAGLIGLLIVSIAALTLSGCGKDETKPTVAAELTVTDPWVRATPPGQKTSAAYMKIASPTADKLIAAEVSPEVADHAELHLAKISTDKADMGGDSGMNDDSGMKDDSDTDDEASHTKQDGAKMTMKQVDSIAVPADGSVELRPGGYHVMLIGLKQQIEAGQKVELTLSFERAGKVKVVAVAKDE